MRRFICTVSILLCVVTSFGCKSFSEPAGDGSESFEIEGTVEYKNIEGGFYAIDGEDGSKYNPVNLPESFQEDGLEVRIKARRERDAMSMHMFGTLIEIIEIKER